MVSIRFEAFLQISSLYILSLFPFREVLVIFVVFSIFSLHFSCENAKMWVAKMPRYGVDEGAEGLTASRLGVYSLGV